jgi:hypothetical protein
MNSETLKTSKEWYLLDTDVDIVGADGWDTSANTSHYDWFFEKITKIEYLNRRNKSSIIEYMKNKHAVPFAYCEK